MTGCKACSIMILMPDLVWVVRILLHNKGMRRLKISGHTASYSEGKKGIRSCCEFLISRQISSVSPSLFLLGLLLCSSPVAYWAPNNMGSSSFNVQCHIFVFSIVHGVLNERILKWFSILSVDRVLSEFSTMTHPSWVPYTAWLIVSLS